MMFLAMKKTTPSATRQHVASRQNEILAPMLTALQMSWQAVSVLMIAEIVSNGMLSLPGALAIVGVSESVPLNHVPELPGSSISLGDHKGLPAKQINQKRVSRTMHISYDESFL
jgi:hypothetical protein